MTIEGTALVLHGGAGQLPEPELARRSDYEEGLHEAACAGAAVLRGGGSALDAVLASVQMLEDHPLFNAGHGGVLGADGTVELSASVMDGATRRAGAVAGLREVQHAAEAARALLSHHHVFVHGPEAERLALAAGCARVEPGSLVTDARRRTWERVRERGAVALDHDSQGTVGAVARDQRGHLAAATSTGGMTNQLPGRIGDAPSIGAGTWAHDSVCAVSTTGTGEAFLRTAFARRVADRIELGGQSLQQACECALEEVAAAGGRGGCIAVDASGHIALPYNSAHMLRAWMRDGDEPRVEL